MVRVGRASVTDARERLEEVLWGLSVCAPVCCSCRRYWPSRWPSRATSAARGPFRPRLPGWSATHRAASARRHRRSLQPRPDREEPLGGHRRHRTIPDGRPAGWRLRAHLQARGVQHGPAGGRPCRVVDRDHRRRPALGSLEETVTVQGESPIVDVQSIKQQRVIGGDTVAASPAHGSITTWSCWCPGYRRGGQDAAASTVPPR